MDWHLMHYGALSHSGAGLLIVEATAITPEGRISPEDLGLWSDDCEEALARLVSSIRAYSSIPLSLQLAHADVGQHSDPRTNDGNAQAGGNGGNGGDAEPGATTAETHTPHTLRLRGLLDTYA